ncbi:MAG: DUF418 domain-containing protein [Flavobacteriaceae bacterium]
MIASSVIGPTILKDRIHFLDILRGISILFIFIANSVYFSGFFDQSQETLQSFATYPLDLFVDFTAFTLIDGKFYSIFSLLFGIGFSIQYLKYSNKKKSFPAFFSRRMAGLLLFGLIHLYFFSGDILTLYALLGFVLILFRNCSNPQLLLFAVILLFLAPMNTILMNISGTFYPYYFFEKFGDFWVHMNLPVQGDHFDFEKDIPYHHTTTNLKDFLTISLGNPLNRLGALLLEGRPFKVLGIFLLGTWVGRKILQDRLLVNSKFLKSVAFWGLIIGLPMNILRTCITFEYLEIASARIIESVCYTLGVVPLACAYAALFALWHLHNKRVLHKFSAVGRMALTNYIAQTFIAIVFFFNIGLGLHGKWGMTVTFSIVIVIFYLQILWSNWWLKRFKFGPLEWLWRQLNYGQRIINSRTLTT